MSNKILFVEDEEDLTLIVADTLRGQGYDVITAADGIQGLEKFKSEGADIVVADVMMPKMDGYELVRELRNANFNTPILLITAKSTINDKKEGFYLGADDYMVKPIDIEELSLRVKALLKRAKLTAEQKIKIGKLVINYNQLSVVKEDKSYTLAQKEFYLLYKLLSNPDKIFTRQELMEEIWGLENESDYRTVDVHIKRIREKLADVNEFEIVTVRGIGYKSIINGEK